MLYLPFVVKRIIYVLRLLNSFFCSLNVSIENFLRLFLIEADNKSDYNLMKERIIQLTQSLFRFHIRSNRMDFLEATLHAVVTGKADFTSPMLCEYLGFCRKTILRTILVVK